jgi:polyphosphate kinase
VRVKFLAIFSSNLDEFFMVRVARLKKRVAAGDQGANADGLNAAETLAAISKEFTSLRKSNTFASCKASSPSSPPRGSIFSDQRK